MGTLAVMLTMLGIVPWLAVLLALAVSVTCAIVEEHLSRPAPCFPPPAPGTGGADTSGVRVPRRPWPQGGSAAAAGAASIRLMDP